ncbi:MAG: response regulator [Syntrophobacter sp.]
MQFKEIIEADNGAEAFEILESTKIDLILSDWDMPVLNGLELLKRVRADGRLKSLPFLMVTSQAHKRNIVKAAQGEVDHYVIKPFSSALLAEKITQIMPLG